MTKKITDPRVHVFAADYSAGVYDESQVNPDIHDGDVLVAGQSKTVAVMCRAWPMAVTEVCGAFHRLAEDADVACLGQQQEIRKTFTISPPGAEPYEQEEVFPAREGTDYTASFHKAVEVARTLDAEVQPRFRPAPPLTQREALMDMLGMSDEQATGFLEDAGDDPDAFIPDMYDPSRAAAGGEASCRSEATGEPGIHGDAA